MTEKVEPALTAEEWAAGETADGNVRAYRGTDGQWWFHASDSDAGAVSGPSIYAAIALANHASPDTNPRKITRADVEWLKNIASALNAAGEQDGALHLAAKLDALLPPT